MFEGQHCLGHPQIFAAGTYRYLSASPLQLAAATNQQDIHQPKQRLMSGIVQDIQLSVSLSAPHCCHMEVAAAHITNIEAMSYFTAV
jgi:hypothetical protein